MTRFFSMLMGAVLLSGTVQAEPASRESVEKLVQLTSGDALINSIRAQFEPIMRQSMQQAVLQKNEGKPLSEAQLAAVNKAAARMAAVMRDEFPWSDIKTRMTNIYAETFEQQEVDAMLAFYASPAGQALINKMPLIAQKSMTMTQEFMKPFAAKMQQAAKEAADEMKAAE